MMHLELSEKSVDEIAERVRQMLEAESSRSNEQSDPEAQELQRKLACIRVKEFVTINEAALLLSCSNGHISNLVKKAKKNQAKNPIPFIDLDGVTVFSREVLLEWAGGSGPRCEQHKILPLSAEAIHFRTLLSACDPD